MLCSLEVMSSVWVVLVLPVVVVVAILPLFIVVVSGEVFTSKAVVRSWGSEHFLVLHLWMVFMSLVVSRNGILFWKVILVVVPLEQVLKSWRFLSSS